jgi:hypothetical protein
MSNIGFGTKISRLTFMLGLGVMSHVMLNGGVTKEIEIINKASEGKDVH